MSPAVQAALEAARPTLFYAAKLQFPGATVRLLDGENTVTIAGETYTGGDEVYGVLAGLEAFTEGADNEAPMIRLTLQPNDIAAWEALRELGSQGSPVTIYEGVLDPQTGVPFADPELVFLGELDVPHAEFSRHRFTIGLDIVSVLERFFDNNEGSRLCDAWHKTFWPGEKGLDQMTGVAKRLPWGTGGGGSGFSGRSSSDFNWFEGSPFTQQTTGKVFNPAKFGLARHLNGLFD